MISSKSVAAIIGLLTMSIAVVKAKHLKTYIPQVGSLIDGLCPEGNEENVSFVSIADGRELDRVLACIEVLSCS